MTPKLFIGIPCYEDRELLHKTIAHIERTTTVPYVLKTHVAKQSVVDNKNVLLTIARDSGAEFICLCDDDIEPLPGWDTTLIAGIEEVQARTGRRVGQSSPLLLNPNGTVFCAWMNVWFHVDGDWQLIDVIGDCPEVSWYTARFEVGSLPGTLTVFTRAFLTRVGWRFDNQYDKSQYEDNDQTLTCRDLGFMALYNGSARVIHHTGGTAPRSAAQNYRKLIDKWRHRADLSYSVEPTEEAIHEAKMHLLGKPKTIFQRFGAMLRLAATRPIGTAVDAISLARRSGMGVLFKYVQHRFGVSPAKPYIDRSTAQKKVP